MHLSDAQIQQYDDDGFVILPGFLSPEEVGLLAAEADILGTPQRGLPDGNVYEYGSGMIRKSYSVDKDSEAYFLASRLPRMLVPSRQLLGERIYLYMTHMNHKIAKKGEIWLWHQDYSHWQLDGVARGGARDMVTIMIMVDKSTPENGPLQILKGSHKLPVEEFRIDLDETSVPTAKVSEARMAEIVKSHEIVECLGAAGTALVFAPMTIHGSARNNSTRTRRNAYFVYNRVDNRPTIEKPRRFHVSPHLMNSDPVELDTGVGDDALLALARRRLSAA
ncbi:MAG: phytanoyl-CoA dioxygenase family protein [Alphaproteobacteria bacterium]|nr:phytanoyl-CoA dioxygenase family protein [Alphaproteobacteria bacterium]